jgi:hypothetical protein
MNNQTKKLERYRNQDIAYELPLGDGLKFGAQLVAMGYPAVRAEAQITGGCRIPVRIARALRFAAHPVLRTLDTSLGWSRESKRASSEEKARKRIVGSDDFRRRRSQWFTYKSIASAVTQSG